MGFPYTKTAGAIPRLLAHIRDAGTPSKVTVKYLASVGFTSSNDRYLVGVLRGLNFISESGAPTDRWRHYRGSSAKTELADAIRNGYAELFTTYPDAYRRDDEAITNFIRGHTDYAATTVQHALRTFRVLCAEADFEAASVDQIAGADTSSAPVESPASQASPIVTIGEATPPVANPAAAVININIQLQLPPSEDGKIYESFFDAMKKHLLS